MTQARRLARFTVLGLLVALFSCVARAEAAGDGLKKVRLAYSDWGIGTAVAYVGIDSGIFKEYGLDVEEVFIRDTLSGGLQALIGVDFVLGFGNGAIILQPILDGRDVVFLGSHVSMEHYRLAVSPNIKSVAQLKGKEIGVSAPGQRSDLIARVIVRRAGLEPGKDVKLVAAGLSPNRILALSKNLIQAAPITPELVPEAEKLGLKILDVKDVPVISALLMTTRSFIKKDEEAARRFVKGYIAAIHYYLANKSKSIAILKKYLTGADPEAVEAMYDAFASQLTPVPLPNEEALQALIDTAPAAGRKGKEIKALDLFDAHFLEELKKSGFVKELYVEKVPL